MKSIKLSEFAKLNGISYATSLNWYKAGDITGSYCDEEGRIYINVADNYLGDIRLAEYAKKKGVGYQTMLKRFGRGKIPGAYKTRTGLIFIRRVMNDQ